jgi:hypothetical protein
MATIPGVEGDSAGREVRRLRQNSNAATTTIKQHARIATNGIHHQSGKASSPTMPPAEESDASAVLAGVVELAVDVGSGPDV